MILDVTFQYAAEVRLRRQRKTETRKYRATVPIQVDEISTEEAPVAFWYNPGTLKANKDRIAVRGHGGKLYAPMPVSADIHLGANAPTAVRQVAVRANRMVDAKFLSRAAEYPGFFVVAQGGARWGERDENCPFLETDTEVAEVRESHLASAERGLRRWYDELKLIDGVVYREIPCPVLFVETRWVPKISIRSSIDEVYRGDLATTFRIDRFEDARKCFAQAAKSSGLGRPSQHDDLRPEIVDASLISEGEARMMLGAAAAQLIKKFADRSSSGWYRWAPLLATAPKEVMREYVLLRDTLERPYDVSELAARINGLCAVMDDGHYRDELGVVRSVMTRLVSDGLMIEELGQAPGMGV